MEVSENASGKVSGIRPPSKIPATQGRGLFELSQSEHNARATASTLMAPPTGIVPSKHKPSNLPEPSSKRVTLAERAGMVNRTNPAAPPSSLPVNGSVKAVTAAGIRNAPTASSASSRFTSGNSMASSVNGFARSTTSQVQRPQTSMGSRNKTNSTAASARPASSLGASSVADHGPPLGKRKAWDTQGRLEDMEKFYSQLKMQMDGTTFERNGLLEIVELSKQRVGELEQIRKTLEQQNTDLQQELTVTKARVSSSATEIEELKVIQSKKFETLEETYSTKLNNLKYDHGRALKIQTEDAARDQLDLKRKNEAEHERLIREHREKLDELARKNRTETEELERKLRADLESERASRDKQVKDITAELDKVRLEATSDTSAKDGKIIILENDLTRRDVDISSAKTLNESLQAQLDKISADYKALQLEKAEAEGKVAHLTSGNEAQLNEYQKMLNQLNAKDQEVKDKLHEKDEEINRVNAKCRELDTTRRQLHNLVSDLKGNIRVFARVRPMIPREISEEAVHADLKFPDAGAENKEIVVLSERAGRPEVNKWKYDRVFNEQHQNVEIFSEISELVQSALDGYNVCIFAYGQTGSGKTYTMLAPDGTGMITQAIKMIYTQTEERRDFGWEYGITGRFIEVYNENINDLVGERDQEKKFKIRHNEEEQKTWLDPDAGARDLTTMAHIDDMMKEAGKKRSVSATLANDQSSRSHSVFMLTLKARNSITGESHEATLNLVDLAGSENVGQSGAVGNQLTEAKNINKSLLALKGTLKELAEGRRDTTSWRNSTLTNLLRFSLLGNSKTLMFVMLSPLKTHESQSKESLRFAEVVNKAQLGPATKVKASNTSAVATTDKGKKK